MLNWNATKTAPTNDFGRHHPLRRLGSLALAIVLAASFVTAAIAKDKGKANDVALSQEIFAAADFACDTLATNVYGAPEDLQVSGWNNVSITDLGPYYSDLSADKNIADFLVDLWGFRETYPDQTVGYCTFSIFAALPFQVDMSQISGVVGTVGGFEITEEGTYGAWTRTVSDGEILIMAHQTTDEFVYQVTRNAASD